MSKTFTVSTKAELIATLRNASGGDVIMLASGNYGALSLVDKNTFDIDFPSTVRLVAADAKNPPVVTGLDLRDASNISFEGITFDYTFADGQPIWHRPFSVTGSENVTFSDCKFDGDDARGMSAVDNGFPTGVGLIVTASSGITVTQSEVAGFHVGMSFNQTDNLTVTGNDVHSVRSDGMNFISVQKVLIENNHIHDFDRSMKSDDHADMIQFWTTGQTRPTIDVIIRGNTLDVGRGEHTQSIFMRNELVDKGLAGPEMFYQNITIENNTVLNGHQTGISVGETAGLTIRGNAVLQSGGSSPGGVDGAVEAQRIAVAAQSTGVVITNNATAEVTGHSGQQGWTVAMNTQEQDQSQGAPNLAGDAAQAPPTQEPSPPASLIPEPPPQEAPTQAPQTQAPQTQAPQTQAPQTQEPQTQEPQTQAPPTQEPPTQEPPTQTPEGTQPPLDTGAVQTPPPGQGGSQTVTPPAATDEAAPTPQGVTVSNHAELIAALRGASGGDVILLASGNYGTLALRDTPAFNIDFPSTVRLVAADAKNPPVITGLDLRDASNISFEGITFDYTFADGQPIWHRPFSVTGSENVTFSDCKFDGDDARGMSAVDNGFPTGVGLIVTASSGITVTQSEVAGFHVGMSFNQTDNLTVTGNDVHSVRSDGMNFISVQKVLIENNHIHDFDRSMKSDDHADMIQFWTTGQTRPTIDVIIRGNTLDVGRGEHTQSIFMRNELVDTGRAGKEMFYQNITIENNVVLNSHLHGISVGETAGLIIRGNSVLHSDGGRPDGADGVVEIPRINVSGQSTGVVITNNATASISGHTGQPGWTVGMNAFVQDQQPNAPGFYGDEFITSSLTPTNGETGFIARPGGMLATLGAGASQTLMATTTDGTALDAGFNVAQSGGAGRVFDAGATIGPQAAGTVYLWDFGDGATGQGRTVTHTYEGSGVYQARLTVVLPDGQRDTAAATIGIQDPMLLHLGTGGTFVLQTFGAEQVVATAAALDAEGGVQLGARGIAASVSRGDLAPMFRSDDVTISFSMDADQANTTGELFRLHQSFTVEVNSKAELLVRAYSSTGDSAWLTTTGIRVNDGASRDVDIRLEEGRLSLWVDGNMVADKAFGGTFADVGNHNLTFGNPWNAGNFKGDLTAFSIAVDDGPTDPTGAMTQDMFAAAHSLDLHTPLI